MNLAPIVLFVYNRPVHTRKTLEALMDNQLASESVLYIFADGPKENADKVEIAAIEKTRDVIRENKWCGEIMILESDRNKGLAASIIDGVTNVVNKYGKIIVLEDDIVTSPKFLSYMNDALNYYESDGKVMHVSAYFPPIKGIKSSFFFYNQTSCWGWGTWKECWSFLQIDALELKNKIIASSRVKEFNLSDSYPFLEHLEKNITGEWNTWAIKWHASIFLLKGLCLHPNKSYVHNIGFDGSGTNCSNDDFFETIDLDLNSNDFQPSNSLVQNSNVLKKIITFNRKSGQIKKRSFARRLLSKIKSIL